METLSLLPLATPAVVLVLGIFAAFRGLPQIIIGTPAILALEYVVLAMPYSYRVIDAGVQAIDVHTLVDASRSLGASWPQVLLRVLMPNLQGAIFERFLSPWRCAWVSMRWPACSRSTPSRCGWFRSA